MTLLDDANEPTINYCKCRSCGQCINVCPTGTVRESKRGYRILVGGKLGRHPRLGTELNSIFSIDETLKIVKNCVKCYMMHNIAGERFGEVLNQMGTGEYLASCSGKNTGK